MELTEQTKLEILCAYLPHGVEVKRPLGNMFILGTYSNMRGSGREQRSIETAITDNYRPILRHPDDMTESELSQLGKFLWNDQGLNNNIARENATNWLKGYLKVSISPQWAINCLRYLHSIHVDTFGAIEAGWAIRKENN